MSLVCKTRTKSRRTGMRLGLLSGGGKIASSEIASPQTDFFVAIIC
jgi:hypothetical protein